MLGDDFAAVLAAARQGDDAAWARVYRDLAPPLLGYLRGRGADDPEGLLGETMLQVVRRIDDFSGDEAGFRSWVFTIAHRRLIDQARARRRRHEQPAPVEDLEPALEPAPDEPGALTSVGTEEVVALLDRLTDDQREVLLLRLVGGLQLPEIAEATGRPPEAVKSLQRRGIAQLRRMLAERTSQRTGRPHPTPDRPRGR